MVSRAIGQFACGILPEIVKSGPRPAETGMIVKVVGGLLVTAVLGAAGLVLGFQGYQAYLKWLTAGQGRPSEASAGVNNG